MYRRTRGVKQGADEGGWRDGSVLQPAPQRAKPLEAQLVSEELSIVCGDEVELWPPTQGSLCLILTP